MSDPIWIPESDVVAMMDLADAIAALERGLAAEARGDAANMVKTHLAWGHNNLHAIGAKLGGLVGTKTWAHTEGGACPLLVLFDATNGALVAVIEAFALGQMRTGGISGVAADWMAKADARTMAIIGTGKQALAQVAAVVAVRPIERLTVYSPNAESRAGFIARVRAEFELDIIECRSVAAATAGADIVTLVTRATAPFLEASMLETGAHINAVGAITPEREEFGQDVFARVGAAAVDSLPAVQKLSRDLMTW
jgi:alanine dehydrogenase